MSESDWALLAYYGLTYLGVSAVGFVVVWLERRERAVARASSQGAHLAPVAGEARSIQEIGHQLKQIGETLSKLPR